MKINETKHSTILVYNIEYFIMSQYIYMYVYLNNESQCYVNNMCILTIFSYRFCKKLILTKISIKKRKIYIHITNIYMVSLLRTSTSQK